MIEYTFNGTVRQSFGLSNPNHAAAIIDVFVVFALWCFSRSQKRCPKVLFAILFILLCVALLSTFSRTGICVFILQIALLVSLKKIKLRLASIFACILLAGLLVCGLVRRFCIDTSILHRLEIWQAGLLLFRANLWHGVGWGNSGLVASAFLLPDGIECRTLVNSFLTLLVETGLRLAILWVPVYIHAAVSGIKKPWTWCAFIGLSISGFCSSALHTPIPLTVLCILLLHLICSPLRKTTLLLSLAILSCAFLLPFKQNVPRIEDNSAFTGVSSFVVYSDGARTLKSLRKNIEVFLPNSSSNCEWKLLPFAPLVELPPDTTAILCGNTAEYTWKLRDKSAILLDPPNIPFNTNAVIAVFNVRFASITGAIF